jgi:hypothetical protein
VSRQGPACPMCGHPSRPGGVRGARAGRGRPLSASPARFVTKTALSILSPSTCGLHDDLPQGVLDPAGHALVRPQARVLAEMLQRIQAARIRSHQPVNALRRQALATEAERFLAAQG